MEPVDNARHSDMQDMLSIVQQSLLVDQNAKVIDRRTRPATASLQRDIKKFFQEDVFKCCLRGFYYRPRR